MAERAIGIAVEKLLAVRRITRRMGWSFYFYASDVGDDLPDLFVSHADALPVGPVSRHDRAGDAVADHLKHLSIGVSMLFLRPRQVWPAAAAVRS